MTTSVRDGSVALVAFGGNVIMRSGEAGTLREQQVNARELCAQLVQRLFGPVSFGDEHGPNVLLSPALASPVPKRGPLP